MPIVLILIGAMLIVSAWKNTFGTLTSALATDLPGFAKWFLAVALVGGLGYVPGLRTPSRWLLGLVMLSLVLKNYTNIFAGLQNAASGASPGAAATGSPSPAAVYAAAPGAAVITTADVSGLAVGQSSTGGVLPASLLGSYATAPVPANPLDPQTYVSNFAATAANDAPMLALDFASLGFGGLI